MDVDNLHFHNFFEIGYCYEGHGILGFNDERLIYDSGTFTTIPALRFVDSNFARDLKAADLARECSISEVHLRRLFCDCVNLPPMDYVNLVRIQKACDLMQKSNYSMDRVAEECGFSSTSTFNRNFVKFMNNTPYQWKLGKKGNKDRLQDYNILAIQGW